MVKKNKYKIGGQKLSNFKWLQGTIVRKVWDLGKAAL